MGGGTRYGVMLKHVLCNKRKKSDVDSQYQMAEGVLQKVAPTAYFGTTATSDGTVDPRNLERSRKAVQKKNCGPLFF